MVRLVLEVLAGFGIMAVVAGTCYGIGRGVEHACKVIQARRFADAAVEWARDEHRKYVWDQWKKDHDL